MDVTKKTKSKRLLSLLLVLCMVATLLPVMSMTAFAENPGSVEIVYIGGDEKSDKEWMEELKKALESEGAKHIILTEDITVSTSTTWEEEVAEWSYHDSENPAGYYNSSCIIGVGIRTKGTKTLNLNGYELAYSWDQKSRGKNDWPTFFTFMVIQDGSNVTIEDSSLKKTGSMDIDGYLTGGGTKGTCGHQRDIFLVEGGGTLTINGGEIVAGHSKKNWVYDGQIYPADRRFDGYARDQINGRVAEVSEGGKIYINGGILKGRGISPRHSNYSKLATIEINKGYVEVRNAEIWGLGGADLFRWYNGYGYNAAQQLNIYSGFFNLDKVDKVILRSIGGPGVRDCSYGTMFIDFDCFHSKSTVFQESSKEYSMDYPISEKEYKAQDWKYNGYINVVAPYKNAEDRGFRLYNENGVNKSATYTESEINSGGITVTPDYFDSNQGFWPEDSIEKYYVDRTVIVFDKDGKKIDAKSYPRIRVYEGNTAEDKKLALSLGKEDFDFKAGNSYKIVYEIVENFNGYNKQYTYERYGTFLINVTDKIQTIDLKMDPMVAGASYGPAVTLGRENSDYKIESQSKWNTGGIPISSEHPLKGGRTYTKTVVLKAKPGKTFDTKNLKISYYNEFTTTITKCTGEEVIIDIEAHSPYDQSQHAHNDNDWVATESGHFKACSCGEKYGECIKHDFGMGEPYYDYDNSVSCTKFTCSTCGYELIVPDKDKINVIRIKSPWPIVAGEGVPTVTIPFIDGFIGEDLVTITKQQWYKPDGTSPLTPGTDKFTDPGTYYLDLEFHTDNYIFDSDGCAVHGQFKEKFATGWGEAMEIIDTADFYDSNKTVKVRLEVEVPKAITLDLTLPSAPKAGGNIEQSNTTGYNTVNPGPTITAPAGSGITDSDIGFSAEWHLDDPSPSFGSGEKGLVGENRDYYLVITDVSVKGGYIVDGFNVKNPEVAEENGWFTEKYEMGDGNIKDIQYFSAKYKTGEDAKLVRDVSVTVPEPVGGATPSTTATKGGDSDKYDITEVKWYPADGTFEETKEYYVYVTVKPKSGYHFGWIGWTNFSVNGEPRIYSEFDFGNVVDLTGGLVQLKYRFPALHTHTYDSGWTSAEGDYDSHYRTCTGCGEQVAEEHKWTKWVKVDDEYHKRTCLVCGIEQQEEHTVSEPVLNPPTPDEDGSQHIECDVCGKGSSSPVMKKLILPKLEAIENVNVSVTEPAEGATPGDATTTESGYTIVDTFWEPDDNPFASYTSYTVTVTVEAEDGKGFRLDDEAPTFMVNGQKATVDYVETKIAMFKYTFPQIEYVFTAGGSSVSKYTLTFETNGGSKVDSVSKASGTSVDLAGYKPTRDGYTFDGWYSDAKLTNKVTSVKLTKNTTVYAKWAEQPAGPFTDVPAGAYYEDAVQWAVAEGITSGASATTFNPNGTCTRAQAVTFLWRAAGSPKMAGAANPFSDVKADSYYADAVLWALDKGITSGTSSTTFAPDAECTRAQIVTFLWRSAGNPVVNYAMNFRDVSADSYYAEAVRWAVSEKITAGTSADAFSPNASCTRAQIVTFLWRGTK